ncbi:MAG: hypothetical protein K9J13_15035 [Saprospiraceae bacterium]|nr:hypothetical protein [Saprospiraceae bacterium]
MYKLVGLLDTSFGFPIIRGYAPILDLIKYSKCPKFQRETDPEHVDNIKEYLKSTTTRFIPELIFSLDVKWDSDNAISVFKNTGELIASENKIPNREIRVDLKVIKYAKQNLTDPFDRVKVEFDDLIDKLGNVVFQPLIRIDGNHRLEALKELNEDQGIDNQNYAFSIIINNNDKREAVAKEIFHTVNSTAKPLESEYLLEAIVDDEKSFPDFELQKNPSFGWTYYFTRKILGLIIIPNHNLFTKCITDANPEKPKLRTFFLEYFNYLESKFEEKNDTKWEPDGKELISNVNSSMIELELFIKHYPIFGRTKGRGLLQAFIYYSMTDRAALEAYKVWIQKNQLQNMDQSTIGELISIFDTILEAKKHVIFVAMPFYSSTNKTFQSIKAIIKKINAEYIDTYFQLELKPLRIDKNLQGHTYNVVDEILINLEECGLVLADLSYANPNVYCEIGYKMGYESSRGNRFDNIILFHVGNKDNFPRPDKTNDIKFDVHNLNIQNYTDLEDLKNNLPDQILRHYGLLNNQTE